MTALAAVLATLTLAAPPVPVTLTVRTTSEHSSARVAHLRCRGASAHGDGFLRAGAARACARARAIAAFLSSPPPAQRLCTQIYGGPERARITGTIGARRVDRTFARRNGCEISDWEKARPVVPRAGGLGATTTP